MADTYRTREIRRVLDAGPADDETWYRLQISGRTATRTLNVSAEEVERILATLD